MMNKYIGIYSFPKSGNTWVRWIIASLYKVDIGKIIDTHQVNINNAFALNGIHYYKSHKDRLHKLPITGHHFACIHILRHPLDVFCSQLNFLSKNVAPSEQILVKYDSVEEVLEKGLIELFFGSFFLNGTLQPRFVDSGDYFTNADYFVNNTQHTFDFPVFNLKYENLVENTVEEIWPVAEFLGFSLTQLEDALEIAGIKTQQNGKFFWKQRKENFKDILPKKLIDIFYENFEEELKNLGYL